MDLVVKLRDPEHQLQVAIAVDPATGPATAGDLILGVVGASGDATLPAGVAVPDEAWPALASLRELIFDHDAEGPFIRPGLSFTIAGRGVDPEARLVDLAVPTEAAGERFLRVEIVVGDLSAAAADERDPAIAAYARMALLHMLGIGRMLDVTRDHDAIAGPLAEIEAEGLVSIDVARATWVLTSQGSATWRKQIDEAQEMLRRYDVFADVDADPSGIIRFDTGHGEDLRVAVIEREARDPFRARFLVGLNDGEWDELPGWTERLADPAWYDEIFDMVARAPGVEEFGAARLDAVRAAGKAFVRDDDAWRRT